MELSARATYRQQQFYVHRIDVWRSTEVINSTDDPGRVEKPAGAKVLSSVPCMWQTGQSQQGSGEGYLVDEDDNLFTLDRLRTEANIDIRVGDAIYQSAGPDAGSWFIARGNPQVRLILNYQQVLCSRTPKPPAWVPQ